ncbi:mRNA interferase RelE/StbE [Methylomarinovum caldicuralii]|uniref:mRNA interferase RelE/StbE n=1 Tax=Methylomarinovum caldicuralii TaxID=438856 RepID=A0AAU9C9X1_9GAMM|nr:type II toxin-antitoxin system RelE/ParE family toxin [Methylomarinovum caldicuralii]BCX81289.1 mRNA interferase RelE/StbE [Methylomarinovum caldicuralii]
MAYKIRLTASAKKTLDKLPKDIQKHLAVAIDNLSQTPRSPGAIKLTGADLYRIRVGHYRIIYHIQDDRLLVLIVKIGHRREVYR